MLSNFPTAVTPEIINFFEMDTVEFLYISFVISGFTSVFYIVSCYLSTPVI